MRLFKVVSFGQKLVRRATVCLLGLAAMLSLGSAASMTLSMLLSAAVYAAAFGWKFALGFVLLLFVHEFGHLLASRIVGLKASNPVFIPFLGAVIRIQDPINAKMEANVAIGGPALGALSALVCLAFYLWTDDMLMLVLSYTACLLNLLNLIPCSPLDGGRIAAAISPHMWWIGTIITGILFLWTSNIFLLVILLFSLVRLWAGEGDLHPRYYQINMRQRLRVAWWYFGLLFVLGGVGLYLVEVMR
ncbi:MAG: site-2 protease family protein [Negativicutes bacterium]|nr:site-2 protease family protein [Negativicutes bacterium]